MTAQPPGVPPERPPHRPGPPPPVPARPIPGGPIPGGPPPAPPPGAPHSGPPAQAATAVGRRGLLLLVLGIAGLALLLSLGASGLSAIALSRANSARQTTAAADTGGAVSAQGYATGEARTNPLPPGGGAPSKPVQVNPRAEYTIAYEKQELRLVQGESCQTTEIDLDEPRVGVSENGDLSISKCSTSPARFALERDSLGSVAASPDQTPKDCAESIRIGPIGTAVVPIQQGVALCIQTSKANANKQGLTQKMVLLDVRAVGADGLVNVVVSAWNVPN